MYINFQVPLSKFSEKDILEAFRQKLKANGNNYVK